LHSHREDTDDCEGGDRIGEENNDDGELTEEPIADDALSEKHMTGDLTEFVTPRGSSFSVSYWKAMQQMEGLPLGILLDFSVYHEMYYTAEGILLDYDARIDPINHSSDYLIQHFQQQWMFGDPDRLTFCWGADANPNAIWHQAHLSEEWSRFAEIVIRLISVGTSEADCEHSLSTQRTIVGAHGTRYETPSLAAHLRLHELSTSERREKPLKQSVLTPQRECRDISQGGHDQTLPE
jgi:hypothetical protein